MKRFPFATLTVLLAAIVACSSDVVTPPPAALNGTWIAPNEVPGSSNVWTLAVAGTSVTGTGTWSGEACCGGTITISGEISNAAVHLDVTVLTTVPTQRPAVHERFDGSLTAPDVLQGVMTFDDGSTAAVHMVRQ